MTFYSALASSCDTCTKGGTKETPCGIRYERDVRAVVKIKDLWGNSNPQIELN